MNRKDIRDLASLLASRHSHLGDGQPGPSEHMRAKIVEDIATFFGARHANFDVEKFVTACKVARS